MLAVSIVRFIGLANAAESGFCASRSAKPRAWSRPSSDRSTSVEPANLSSADRIVAP
jgi:hypothetical protein